MKNIVIKTILFGAVAFVLGTDRLLAQTGADIIASEGVLPAGTPLKGVKKIDIK